MFSYLVSHFFNHSLGLISLDALEEALYWIFRFWTSWPGSIALYGAFLTHFLLALYALWARRSLRLSRTEIVQYSLGFLVPLMLADHVVGTRVSDAFYKSNFGYYRSLLTVYFHDDTPRGVVQAVVLVVAWVHGCIGLRFWLRLKPWYERAQRF